MGSQCCASVLFFLPSLTLAVVTDSPLTHSARQPGRNNQGPRTKSSLSTSSSPTKEPACPQPQASDFARSRKQRLPAHQALRRAHRYHSPEAARLRTCPRCPPASSPTTHPAPAGRRRQRPPPRHPQHPIKDQFFVREQLKKYLKHGPARRPHRHLRPHHAPLSSTGLHLRSRDTEDRHQPEEPQGFASARRPGRRWHRPRVPLRYDERHHGQ